MHQATKPTSESRSGRAPSAPVKPHPPLREYYGADDQRQHFLNDLFDRTAPQYRWIDRATAFGSGLWYRRKALQEAGLTAGMTVLDVACGSGLVAQGAVDLVGPSGSVIGLDPSVGMLKEAQKGACRILVRGVGEQLPFPDAQFDFLSMGYALRHVPDLKTAFAEYRRVLKPGGILLLMEIARPRSALLKALSRFYLKTVLGGVFSVTTRNRDIRTLMGYWWDTIESCVTPAEVLGALRSVGFIDCTIKQWWNGLMCDYRAVNL